MKPYGQKQEKTRRGIHNSDNCGCEICNTGGWKVLKSRARHDSEEVDDFLTSNEISQFEELEYTVKIRAIDDQLFEASSNVFEEKALAIDPDEAREKLAHILYKKEKI